MVWSIEETKAFEKALAELGHDHPNLVQEIGLRVPSKTKEQIQMHYDELNKDVEMVESDEQKGSISNPPNAQTPRKPRKRPTPWTVEEHVGFLWGLDIYGKGDWKRISKYCVPTRSTRQISSHAQKYFLKLRKQAALVADLLEDASSSGSK